MRETCHACMRSLFCAHFVRGSLRDGVTTVRNEFCIFPLLLLRSSLLRKHSWKRCVDRGSCPRVRLLAARDMRVPNARHANSYLCL